MSRLAPVRQRLARARRRASSGLIAAGAWAARRLPLGERGEGLLLRRIWNARSATMLDAYLVSGYQNPHVNVQSILLRHHLIGLLFDDDFADEMEAELWHAVDLNERLRRRAAELGVRMGSYLNPAKQAAVRRVDEAIAADEDRFAVRWRSLLAGRQPRRLAVLELACGSANDYRAFAEYGLAPHLEYRGIDVTEKNIANARRRFPDVPFEVGDARRLRFEDGSVDLVVASDLFEHLSIEGMEEALDEAMRVARRGLALTFFNMGPEPDHLVERRGAYHWNRLSRPRIEARLRARFPSIRTVAVADLLGDRYGYARTYNRHAYSIFAAR